MTFPDITAKLKSQMPELRGRMLANEPLAPLTWFRVGGPAQVLFTPEDEDDLAYFLAHLPAEVAIYPVGVGSNLLVRDGGVAGVVIRLGRGFAKIAIEPGHRVRAGAAVPDVKVARAAAEAGIDGLAFFRGIPGTIGGALRMNAGAYGGETRDAFVAASAVDRARVVGLSLPDWPTFDWFFADTHAIIFITLAMMAATVAIIAIGASLASDRRPAPDIVLYLFLYGLIAPWWLFRAMFNVAIAREGSWAQEIDQRRRAGQ